VGLLEDFLADPQGKRFAELRSEEIFAKLLRFFARPDRQRRMIEAERHHDRPPLAGVIRELDEEFFATKPRTRVRHFVGVLTKVVMAQHGWKPSGKRGSLGKELSRWITRSERYSAPTEQQAISRSDGARRYHERQAKAQELRKKVEGIDFSLVPPRSTEKTLLLGYIRHATRSQKLLATIEKVIDWRDGVAVRELFRRLRAEQPEE